MAETKIAGRNGTTMIVSDSFSPYGEVHGGASYQENPDAYEVKWVKDPEIRREQRWTDEQLRTARAFLSFPAGELRTIPGWPWNSQVRCTRADQIQAWRDHYQSLAPER